MIRKIVKRLNEGVVSDTYNFLKQQKLSTPLINKILKIILNKKIDEYLDEIVERVNPGNKALKRDLKNIFTLSNLKPIDTIKVLEKCGKNEGILKEKLDANSLLDLSTLKLPGLEEVLKDVFLLTTKKKGQGSTSVGVGEIFIAVFGKNGRLLVGKKKGKKTIKPSGDVYYINRKIEVKTSGNVAKSIWHSVPEITLNEEEAKILNLTPGRYTTEYIQDKFGESVDKVKKNNKEVFLLLFKKYMIDNIKVSKYKKDALKFYEKNKNLEPDILLKKYLNFWFQGDHNLFEDYKKEEGFDTLLYFATKNENVYKVKEFSTTLKDLPLTFTGFYSNGNRGAINIRINSKDKIA